MIGTYLKPVGTSSEICLTPKYSLIIQINFIFFKNILYNIDSYSIIKMKYQFLRYTFDIKVCHSCLILEF